MNPASITHRAKRATCGLMPGISVITITAGPVPAISTFLVTPSNVMSRVMKSSSLSSKVKSCVMLRVVMAVGLSGNCVFAMLN